MIVGVGSFFPRLTLISSIEDQDGRITSRHGEYKINAYLG